MATNAKNLAELLNTDTTVKVGDIEDGSVTTAKLAASAVTTAKVADNAVTSAKLFANNLGRRNLVINGAMQVAQRNTSFTGHGAGVNYGIDRFFDFHNSDGAFTLSQETSVVPTDFTHALKVQTTTADSSIGAGQRLIVGHRFEGQNVAHLKWGTSDAKTITVSFYVRSSITGTHGGAIGNGSDNRNYPFTYTISSADTWERKTITIPGDTTGTWATGSGRSIQITWGLGVGTTYSGTAGAWAAGDKNSATGATTGVLGTLNATWYLTGVQLEVGDTATDFEHRSFGEELSLCQRYYTTSYDIGHYPGQATAQGALFSRVYGNSAVSNVPQQVQFPVTMRGAPSVTVYSLNGTSGNISDCATGYTHTANDAIGISGTIGFKGWSKLNSVTVTAGDIIGYHYTAAAEL